jgi:hypothetical protein
MRRPAGQVIELACSGKFRSDQGPIFSPAARPGGGGIRSRMQERCVWQMYWTGQVIVGRCVAGARIVGCHNMGSSRV